MPRKLSYINNSQSLKPHSSNNNNTSNSNHSANNHHSNIATSQHQHHQQQQQQQQQLMKQQQRHHRDITNTLQQIRDGNREHSRVLNQGLQMLSAAITKLVDSKICPSSAAETMTSKSTPTLASPRATPLSTAVHKIKAAKQADAPVSTPREDLGVDGNNALVDAAADVDEDEEDKCTFVDHQMINDRNDNEVHIPLVQSSNQSNCCDDQPMPLVNVGQCDDDEIDDEIDEVVNDAN